MSCRTSATRSSGASVSSTTRSANPLGLGERPRHPVGQRSQMRALLLKLLGLPFVRVHPVTFSTLRVSIPKDHSATAT